MTTNAAVRQAIELLRGHRDELLTRLRTIQQEVDEVSAALVSLGVHDGDGAVTSSLKSTVASRPENVSTPSIRQVVSDLLNSENRQFSMDEITAHLVRAFPARDGDKLRANVRAALYHMRGKKEVTGVGHGRHIATKWLPQNAESPVADTGLSVVPAHDSLEGGEADGTGDHRDHDPGEGHRDHVGGAPAVVGGGFL